MKELIVFGALCAGTHWIVARSTIMHWFWSRAARLQTLDTLLRCPACFGWWCGLAWGGLQVYPVNVGSVYLNLVIAGVLGAFFTPIFEAIMLTGLNRATINGIDEDAPDVSPEVRPTLPKQSVDVHEDTQRSPVKVPGGPS